MKEKLYEKSKYASIVIDGQRIVALVGYNSENQLIVERAHESKLQSKLTMYENIQRFIYNNHLENLQICICKKSPFKSKFLQLPTINRKMIRQMLDNSVEQYIDWQEENFVTQFICKEDSLFKKDNKDMDVFIVAIPEETVKECGFGVMKTDALLEIITFWPGEIQRLYEEESMVLLIRLEQETACLQLWFREMLCNELIVENTPIAIGDGIERINELLFSQTERYIDGIHILSDDEGKVSEKAIMWNSIGKYVGDLYHQFGKAALRNIHYLPGTEVLIDQENMTWNAALGGLYRSVCV